MLFLLFMCIYHSILNGEVSLLGLFQIKLINHRFDHIWYLRSSDLYWYFFSVQSFCVTMLDEWDIWIILLFKGKIYEEEGLGSILSLVLWYLMFVSEEISNNAGMPQILIVLIDKLLWCSFPNVSYFNWLYNWTPHEEI